MDAVREVYLKQAPKWLRTIRWREMTNRSIDRFRTLFPIFYGPFIFYYITVEDHWAWWVVLNKPKDAEETLKLRQNWKVRPYHRDPNITPGQYYNDLVPRYDMSVRRLKYPEYYAGRYDGERKYYV